MHHRVYAPSFPLTLFQIFFLKINWRDFIILWISWVNCGVIICTCINPAGREALAIGTDLTWNPFSWWEVLSRTLARGTEHLIRFFGRETDREWLHSDILSEPPKTPWIDYFPATRSWQGQGIFFQSSRPSKNLPEKKIFWGKWLLCLLFSVCLFFF